MLATGKGWVLPVLAMLAPEAGRCAWLRAGPVPAQNGAALSFRCAPCRTKSVGTKGVPPTDAPRALPRGRRTKGTQAKAMLAIRIGIVTPQVRITFCTSDQWDPTWTGTGRTGAARWQMGADMAPPPHQGRAGRGEGMGTRGRPGARHGAAGSVDRGWNAVAEVARAPGPDQPGRRHLPGCPLPSVSPSNVLLPAKGCPMSPDTCPRLRAGG